MGPMQFLPSTFAHYAVDGDHDGLLDIMSPGDAIFTAARYLCANGGGGECEGSSRPTQVSRGSGLFSCIRSLTLSCVRSL